MQDGRTLQEHSYKDVSWESQPRDDIDKVNNWQQVLQNYASRSLTFRSDKLLALSGLAYEYHQLHPNDRYLAGLWTTMLPQALSWHAVHNKPEQENGSQPPKGIMHKVYQALFEGKRSRPPNQSTADKEQYIAPSWSPLSRSGGFQFMLPLLPKEPDTSTSLVTINEARADVTSSVAPFGQISGACLDLTGPMCGIEWSDLTAIFMVITEGRPHIYWDIIIPDDPQWYKDMCALEEPSFNPQSLNGNILLHPPAIPEGAEDPSANAIAAQPARLGVQQALIDLPPVNTIDEVIPGSYLTSAAAVPQTNALTNDMYSSTDNDLTFWLLEIEHSKTPAGLLLKRVRANVFKRIGYYGVNRSKDPETLIHNGHHVSGPVNRNWDDILRLRRIFVI